MDVHARVNKESIKTESFLEMDAGGWAAILIDDSNTYNNNQCRNREVNS